MPVYKSVAYTLKKRGDSYQFNVRVLEDGKPKRIRQQFPTEDEARTAAEAAIDRGLAGVSAVAPAAEKFATPTLQKVYELLHARQWRGSKGERSAVKNALDCVAILGTNTPINKIGTLDVDRLITELKDRGLAAGTVRRKLAALSTIIKFAASRHFIDTVPLIDRKSAGKERKRVRYLRDDEEKNGLDYLKIIGKNYEFFAFLIDTGLRLSEAVNLETRNIKRAGGGIEAVELLDQEMVKNGEFRVIPATERVKSILKDRLDKLPMGKKQVWWDMTCDRAEWEWGLMRENLGLTYDKATGVGDRDFVIHACRHTFASRLAMAGVSLQTIKVLGGWRTLDMVLRYSHMDQASSIDAINRMQSHRKIG